MKLFMTITWGLTIIGTIFGGLIILVSLKESDIFGSNNITTAIACGVLPFCFAYALSKLTEKTEKK